MCSRPAALSQVTKSRSTGSIAWVSSLSMHRHPSMNESATQILSLTYHRMRFSVHGVSLNGAGPHLPACRLILKALGRLNHCRGQQCKAGHERICLSHERRLLDTLWEGGFTQGQLWLPNNSNRASPMCPVPRPAWDVSRCPMRWTVLKQGMHPQADLLVRGWGRYLPGDHRGSCPPLEPTGRHRRCRPS